MIASLEGGYSIWERKRMVDQALAHDADITGYFLDGFHRNGSEGLKNNSKNRRNSLKFLNLQLQI